MEKDDVVKALRQAQASQTLRTFSRTIGCSTAYLSDIYNNKREPGPKILDYLGITKETEKKTTYRWR
jgi:hypothetical protein